MNDNIALNDLSERVHSAALDWTNSEADIQLIMEQYFPSLSLNSSEPLASSLEATTSSDHIRKLCNPLIIAADVIYWECLFLPLVQTLVLLCSKFNAKVIISHIRRWKKDAKFLQLCKKYRLDVTVLKEQIDYLPHEHTGELEKQISRVYFIQSSVTK
jgi:hypothetical protein